MATGLRGIAPSAAFNMAAEEEEIIHRPRLGSESDRALDQGMQNIRAQGVGLRALGKAIYGDDEGATQDALKSVSITEEAAKAGPRVQSFTDDVHGAGDLAEYARNTLLTQGPGLVTTLAGGLGGVGVRAAVQQGAKKAVSKAVAAQAATRAAAAGASAASAAQTAGAGAGENLTMEGEGSLRERAAKTVSTSIASGALDALPALRLLKRSGLLPAAKGEVQRQTGRLLTRIGKEAGQQALYEGMTETAQAALERSAQKWIDKRINLLAPEEFSRYVDSFAAGAVLGGGFGAGATALGARPSLTGKVREAIVNRRAKPAESAPSASVADMADRNEELLKGANDDLDSLLDEDTLLDDDGDDFGVDYLGEGTPGPEAALEALQSAPPAIQRALKMAQSQQAPEGARLRAQLMVEDWMAQNDAPAPAAALTEDGQAMMPETPAAARALAQLARRPLRQDYDPTQPLATMVQGSRGLSDDDFSALRDYDATLSVPERKAIADRIYGLSPNAPEEAARLRRMTAKGGGVAVDPRVFAAGLRGVGTKNYMSDRVLRSALVDLSRTGNEAATTFMESLDSKVQAAVKDKPPKARREAADLVYTRALKELGNTNPQLLEQVRGQLRESYEGVSPAYAAQTEASATSIPDTELQVIDEDGNEVLVDVPQQINYIRSVSGERAAGDGSSPAFRQQLADAYGKLLEVIGGSQDQATAQKVGRFNFKLGTGLADPRAMARDNLVLYVDPKTKKTVTLGNLRADGFFEAEPPTQDPADPANFTQEMGAEAEGDQRVPGGDTFRVDPRRPAEPQEDVLEALAGVPAEQANERIEAKPDKQPQAQQQFDIDALQEEITELGKSASSMTPEQRVQADVAGQMKELRAQLRVAFTKAKESKLKRAKIKRSQLKKVESLEGKAPPAKPVEKSAKPADVRPKIQARRDAKVASLPKQEKPDAAAGATGKDVTNDTRKKRADSAAAKAAEVSAAKLNVKLDRDNAAAAAAAERGRQPASETQVRIMYNQLKNVTERGADYVRKLVESAGGATLGQMFEIQTLATQLRRGAIDGTQFKKGIDRVFSRADDSDKATNGFKAWLKERAKGKRPSETQLQNLANATLEWLGVDAKVKVRYATDADKVSLGVATPKADGSFEIVLSDVQRGADLISTLSHEIGHVVKWTAYNKADKATQDAILKDYHEWLEENNKGVFRSAHVFSSRGTAARQQQLAEFDQPGKSLNDMTPQEREYLLDFDEWFADQVARYLTTERASNTLVAKFFKAVGRQLVQLAQAFGAKAAPAKAVKNFLDAMSPDKIVRQQTELEAAITATVNRERMPEGVTAEQGAAAVNNVTQPGSQESLYSIIDTFRRLPASTQNVLRRVVRRENVLAKLRSKVQDPAVLRAMDHPATADETRMAVAFELWRADELKLREIQGPFRTVWDGFLKSLGLLTKSDYFEQFLVDVQAGKAPRGPKNYSVFKRSAKNANAAAKSFAALDEYYRSTVVPIAQKIFSTGVGERMMNSGIPAMVEFALKMKVPTGARQQTDVGLFQQRMRMANSLNTKYGAAIEGMDESDLADINAALQQAAPVSSLTPEQKKAYDAIRAHFDSTLAYLQQAGVDVKGRKNYYPIVMLEPDMLAQKKDAFIKFFADNFAPQMRAKLLTILGGEYYDGMSKQHRDDVTANRAELTKQLDKRSPESLAESFYAMALGEDPSVAVEWDKGARPGFRYMNEQLMDFVLDARPELRTKFAEFREENLSFVVARYNEAAAKRAEFQRRFPHDDDVKKFFDDAEKQGATPEQIDLMHSYLDVMMGNYGLQYPAALKHVLGGVDKLLGTKVAENPATLRKIQGFITVYQNLRLLGLATLSSLVDALGISVRSGKFTDAWGAYRDTFKAIRKKGGLEDVWKMAEDLGVVETSATNEALAMAYGGIHLSRGARKINDFFFNAIGLTRWTQATRVAAVAMGHRFLARHADGKGEHSARYLDELGLKPSDIKVNDDGFVEMNDKVRDALLQFVDESVLRPDPSQRPLWMSDPNYMLLSQYKSFTYAFQNTILKRIGVEFREGNYQPLLTALAYVPLMLGAELLREVIQHGPEGDPRREDWGAAEYGWHATQRTGMLGPREYLTDAFSDPAHGNLPGASFLGPSVAQARSVTGDKAPSTKAIEALPASSVWKHHVPKGEPVEPLETN